MGMTKLRPKQKRFIEEYLVDLNATQAAIRAGYKKTFAKDQGYENLTKPHIQEAIQEAMERRSARTQITQDRVLQELGRIAFVDPRKFFDSKGKLIPVADLDEDTARAVGGLDYHAEWETSKDSKDESKEVMGSTTKIKLIDKRGALDSIGKHLGMFIERRETGRPGQFNELSDEQLDQRIREETKSLGYGPGAKASDGTEPTKDVPTVH